MTNLSKTQCVFTPKAGTVEGPVSCGVCGKTMDMERNIDGPTSSVEGMAGHKHLHDLFTCSNREEKWHLQVAALRREQQKTASSLIEEILEKEIDLVLYHKQPTKKLSVHTGL